MMNVTLGFSNLYISDCKETASFCNVDDGRDCLVTSECIW